MTSSLFQWLAENRRNTIVYYSFSPSCWWHR